MKSIISKSYMTIFFLFATFIAFADDPGDDTAGGNLNGDDPLPAPIGDYIWVLALLGIVFVFLTFRAIQNKRIQD